MQCKNISAVIPRLMSNMSTSALLSNSLLLIPLILMLLTSATFLLGGIVQPWMFPASVAIATVYIFFHGGFSRQWKCAAIFFAIIIASLIISASIHENTYDIYHQEIAVAIDKGWNPIHPCDYELTLWSNYYLKFIEIVQGCIMSTTGSLDSGKAINLMLIFALIFSAIDFLTARVNSKRRRIAIIVVMMCNPVMLTGMFTSYIDIYLYIFTCLTLMLFVKIWENPSKQLWGWLVGITLMCAGTKLNIFFYQIIYLLCFLGWILFHHRRELVSGWIISAIVTAVLIPILFWHPYITNTITMGNPAYPLLGEGSTDIMSGNTPDIFLSINNRFANFFASLVGWCFDKKSILITYDSRICGFGLFFLPILIISFWRAFLKYKKWPKAALAIMLMLLLSCFAFDQTWWARYICQLWIIPVIALICMQKGNKSIWRNLILALSLMTMCQSLPSFANSIGCTIRYNLYKEVLSHKNVSIDHTPSVFEHYQLNEIPVTVSVVPEGSLNPDKTIYLRADHFYVEVDDPTIQIIESRKDAFNPLIKKIAFP